MFEEEVGENYLKKRLYLFLEMKHPSFQVSAGNVGNKYLTTTTTERASKRQKRLKQESNTSPLLQNPLLWIGRESKNDVVISHPGVSRQHCSIGTISQDKVKITNYGRHGIKVNGKQIGENGESVEAAIGSTISIGRFKFLLRLREDDFYFKKASSTQISPLGVSGELPTDQFVQGSCELQSSLSPLTSSSSNSKTRNDPPHFKRKEAKTLKISPLEISCSFAANADDQNEAKESS
mmetsp:Transcript_11435/g.15608  ORF Transcript_11435/g.15608 Transcript_11435/m.15608 type:complete len:236 (+) Transcript_11435:67-774(+)